MQALLAAYGERKRWEARLIAVELAGPFGGRRDRQQAKVPGYVMVEQMMGVKL